MEGVTISGARGGYGSYGRYGGNLAYDYYDYEYGYSAGGHGGGAIHTTPHTSPVIANCVITGAQIYGGYGGVWDYDIPGGYNGHEGINGGSAYGGGIYIGPRSSPTIVNCTVSDCNVIGGDGGPGHDGGGWSDDLLRTGDGGRGGWPGRAYGGGIYCASQSTPTVIGCTISGCQAIGGNGGDGGNAGDIGGEGGYGGGWSSSGELDYWYAWDYPFGFGPFIGAYGYSYWYTQERWFLVNGQLWEHWHYAEGPWHYSGHGGGVYCAPDSKATFTNCTISNNIADGGLNGMGGIDGIGIQELPVYRYDISGWGGGIYCAPDSEVMLAGCDVVNNTLEDHSGALQPYPPSHPLYDPNDPNVVAPHPSYPDLDPNQYDRLPYTGYGGGMCTRDAEETIVTGCDFSNNIVASGFGGAIHSVGSSLEIDTSGLAGNLAMKGGGLSALGGMFRMAGCDISGNIAVVAGEGAGMYIAQTDAEIVDSIIQYNYAYWSGGGLYWSGDPNSKDDANDSIIHNCLITGNWAYSDGGGISCNWHAEPVISNCTFSNNVVAGSPSYGGDLYCSYASDVKLIDSIIWSTVDSGSSQVAVAGYDPYPYLSQPSRLAVSFSDIRGGRDAILVEPECTLLWNGSTNLEADPLFTNGYYLSNRDVEDQQVSSPCIDVGSDLALNIGLHTYTTRTDGVEDDDTVDIGFHYFEGIARNNLTVIVIEDPCTIGLHSIVEPSSGDFEDGEVVTLVAYPDPCANSCGYGIKSWSGTDDDSSTALTNTVTMIGDRHVTVEFELAPRHHLAVNVDGGLGLFSVDDDANQVSSFDANYCDDTVVTLTAHPNSSEGCGYRVIWADTDNDASMALTNTVTMTR
ncbi:MAG: InlB B-repeat-containing protein, partial [Planctomycetota bacterium]